VNAVFALKLYRIGYLDAAIGQPRQKVATVNGMDGTMT